MSYHAILVIRHGKETFQGAESETVPLSASRVRPRFLAVLHPLGVCRFFDTPGSADSSGDLTCFVSKSDKPAQFASDANPAQILEPRTGTELIHTSNCRVQIDEAL